MMTSMSPDHEIYQQTEAHLLGQLTDDQIDALNQRLLHDPIAREQCALAFEIMSMVHEDFCRQEENIKTHAGEPLLRDFDAIFEELLQFENQAKVITVRSDTTQNNRAEPLRPEQSLEWADVAGATGYLLRQGVKSRPVKWLAAAVILLVVSLVVVLVMSGGGANEPATAQNQGGEQPPAPSTNTVVATLTAEHDAIWDDLDITPGKSLYAGQRMTLSHGLVELMTGRGARVILEAPCTIELADDDNELRLHEGRLFGVCVTPASRGFTVVTEHARVVDLGTRFGVRVSGHGESEVRVFEGEVAVKPEPLLDRPRTTRTLTAGQGVSLTDPAMTVLDTSAEPMAFVSDRAFVMRQRDAGQLRGHLRAYSEEMAQHSDVVAFFDMTPDPDNPALLINRSAHGEAFVSNGTIVEASPVRGRHGLQSALSFDTEKQVRSYVRIEGKREMESITLAAWVRLKSHDKPHTAILNSDTHVGPGEVHWQIDQAGSLQFTGARSGRQGESIGVNTMSEGLSGLTDGGWHHLATTVDSQTGVVHFYLDGTLIQGDGATGFKHKINLSLARIGHWVPQEADSKNWDRQFQGEMDELIIFKRALSGDEIQGLYEYGTGPKEAPEQDTP